MDSQDGWLSGVAALVPGLSTLAESPEAVAAVGWIIVVSGLLGLAFGLLLGAFVAARLGGRFDARLKDSFHALSSEALDRSSDRLLALAGERLGALERSNAEALARREQAVDSLVRPIHDSLSRVDAKLGQVEAARIGQHASLERHLELSARAQRELREETRSLSQALRAPGARGRWGELQLRRVVELAGMLEHCDFQEQTTITTGEGRARPDLVVRLPGGRAIAIDAKAPLDAFLAASEAVDDEQRDAHLDRHARHVRRHLDQLGARAYGSALEASLDFVVLFLPGEPFFAEALSRDPGLVERGVERKVFLAGPTTLIALLRAVAHGWQQESLAENAATVARLGRELFDRIVTLGDHFAALGRRLDGAVDAYNSAMGSLETRVHVSARRMAELGVTDPGTLPSPNPVERRARRFPGGRATLAVDERGPGATPRATHGATPSAPHGAAD